MAIALVQNQAAYSDTSADNADSDTISSNVTAGNLLVLVFAIASSGGGATSNFVTSLTDGLGNTWTRAGTAEALVAGSSNRGHVAVFYVKNCTGGSLTWTAGYSSSMYSAVFFAEFSGIDTTAPLDLENFTTNGNSGTSTTPSTGSTGTLGQADELIIGGFQHWNGTISITPDQTGMGEIESSAGAAAAASYQIVASTSTTANTWTIGSSAGWGAGFATFKAAAGGGATVGGPLAGGKLAGGFLTGRLAH